VIAFILGLVTAILVLIFVSFFGTMPSHILIIIAGSSFLSSFLLIFLALEYFVFKEIDQIYDILEKIKHQDYTIKPLKVEANSNPLIKIKGEIFEFAENKQREINQLKKLETFRREFLADVSHELKTPLFAAQGFVHTLLDGAINDLEVRDRFLQKSANSLDGLNILVEDLITISQLEIGEIRMNYQNFDIHKTVSDIYDQLDEATKRKGAKLKFFKNTPRSCYVFADKNRINQVMTNLIVNAIKYGKDKGTVITSLVVENDYVFVSVKDDGPGIEQQHLNRIFERFYRIDRSRAKDRGGTGLGLAIVKHILEAHNSKIYVSSKPGSGTIFSFKLKKGKVINEKG
jgi:two-component system phosphate regulon sensor histidine kinase PhoR